MGWNKVKAIKRLSRKEHGQHGRGGAHDLKTHKDKYRKHARDYVSEWDELEEEERLDLQNREARHAWERETDEQESNDDAPVGDR